MILKGSPFGNPTGGQFKLEKDDWVSFWVYIFNVAQNGTLFTIMKSDGTTERKAYLLDGGKLCNINMRGANSTKCDTDTNFAK